MLHALILQKFLTANKKLKNREREGRKKNELTDHLKLIDSKDSI